MAGNTRKIALAAGLFALTTQGSAASGQVSTPSVAATAVAGPAVGEVAPDFTLNGATRYGVLKTPVRLADFRGRTVVLAFFYQARTKG